jgi:hypothetical protein
MPLPETIRQHAEEILDRYCRRKIPARLRDEIQLSFAIRGNSITLYETRPMLLDRAKSSRLAIAQFRFDSESKCWTLFCADRNSKWHDYLDSDSTPRLERLLKEVDDDPTGIFWG